MSDRTVTRRACLVGLLSRHAGQTPGTLMPQLEARILECSVRGKPAHGATQWSTRRLAQLLGVSRMMVARVWRKHALQPQRLEGYRASDDPGFETEAADIIGLYLNSPQHAAVFCVDKKTANQSLDRLDPVLPLSTGRAERHAFEYNRHGRLSLYAAFNTRTGEVLDTTASRHTSVEFVAFLTDIVVNQPRGKEIHVIARGVFTVATDLEKKLMRYICHCNKAPRTVKWKYFDPTRRFASTSVGTVHYPSCSWRRP